MKNLFKNISIGFILLVLATNVFGVAVTVTLNTTPTQVVAGGLKTSQFIFSNTNTTANATFTVFDAPTAVTTNVIPAYTNVTYTTVSSITNAYTNYFGVVNSNVYSAITHATNSVAATTNTYPVMFSEIVPSNSTMTVDFAQRFQSGVTVSNTAGGSVTVTFSQ